MAWKKRNAAIKRKSEAAPRRTDNTMTINKNNKIMSTKHYTKK